MANVFNTVGGGGGSPNYALLQVTCDTTFYTPTSVTAVKGLMTVDLVYSSVRDVWEARLTSVGTWTITAVNGVNYDRKTIIVDNFVPYAVELRINYLPSEVIQVEYVEGNPVYGVDTPYISTSLLPTNNNKITGVVAFPNISGSSWERASVPVYPLTCSSVYGWSASTSFATYYPVMYIRFSTGLNFRYTSYRSRYYETDAAFNIWKTSFTYTLYQISATIGSFSLQLASTSYSANTSNHLYYLSLGLGNVGSSDNSAAYKIRHWNLKMYASTNSTSLIHDLWPCKRASDGVVGMYDRLSYVFYPATGNVTAGPEV